MKRMMMFLAAALLVTGCSTMTPARYSVSVDTNQILKQFKGEKAVMVTMNAPQSFDPFCRLMGPIQAADGMSIPEFIRKAFNDELKFAELYDEGAGVKLSGTMDNISFSSSSGLTNGWWDLGMTLRSANGKSLTVSNRYDFPSGFDAITACNQTAQALGPAVQDLIKKAVSDPAFRGLISQ